MAVVVGSLIIDLKANTASFSQSMDKMSSLSAKTANECKRSLEKIGTMGLAMAAGLAAGTAALIETSVSAIGSLNRLAQASGTTIEKFSALAYAAKVSHVEVEDMAKGMEKLAKSAYGAQNGNAALSGLFTRLGVTTQDANHHLLDTSDIFTSVAVKFSQMANGAGKTALAMALFGKAGAGMIPLLNRFGSEQKEIIAEAKEFGLVIGGEVPAQARAYHELFVKLHAAQQGFGIQLTAAVLPALAGLSERLQNLGKSVNIPDLAAAFGSKVSSAVNVLSGALEFAVRNAGALKVAIEALAAIQIAKFAIPFALEVITSGTLTAGVLKLTTSLLGISKLLPLLSQFAAWASGTTAALISLASTEGIAATASYVLGGALAFLTAPVTIVVGVIAALSAGLYYFRDSTFHASGEIYKLRDAMAALWAIGKHWGPTSDWTWSGELAKAKKAREAADSMQAKPKAPYTPTVLPPAETQGIGKEKKEKNDYYGEEIGKLNQLVAAQRGYLTVLGDTPEKLQEMASFEKAEGIILEQNTKLVAAKEAKLTALQMATIRQTVASLDALTALNEYGKSLVSLQHSTDLSIIQTQALAAAHLQGEEAVRRATVANAILGLTWGKSTEQLEAMHGELVKVAGLIMGKSSADQVESTNKDIYGLEQELATRKLTVDAIGKSTEEQRKAALAAKLYAINQQIANTTDLAALEALKQKRQLMTDLVKLEQSEADKQAAVALAKKALEDLSSPMEHYQAELKALQEEAAALESSQKHKLSDAQAAMVAAKAQDAFNKATDETVNLLLRSGKASDGFTAFFLDMQKQAKSTAAIIYEAIHQAFDKLADNLTELMTGGKTSFGKMFQDIGKQMLNSSIKKAMQGGLSKIAGMLGIDQDSELKGKPDGTPLNPFWVKIIPSMMGTGGGAGSMTTLSDGIMTGSQGGAIFNVLGSVVSGLAGLGGGGGGGAAGGTDVSSTISYPGMAGGGAVSADRAYLVGENGPEILRGASGRISSNSASRRELSQNGPVAYYSIDARGTDPALVEQRVKSALVAVHGSAISISIQANNELKKRTPQV